MSDLISDSICGAQWVGGHLALDLLNTQSRDADGAVEHWRSGEDVLTWLEHGGIVMPLQQAIDRSDLLARATHLRTLARSLIERHKEGVLEDLGDINNYLHAYLSAPHLERLVDGTLTLSRVTRVDGIASLLGPVAQAVAQLLVEGDACLIKQCEHPDCILWFYDRTKASKRRWCSMSICGNRYKAAQFKKRKAARLDE